jgi:hypothetical protein
MEADRKVKRATDARALEDAERHVAARNERQARRNALAVRPDDRYRTGGPLPVSVCRTTQAVDLRALDRHRDMAR